MRNSVTSAKTDIVDMNNMVDIIQYLAFNDLKLSRTYNYSV